MPTVREMAEAHLLNVQNEIQNVDRKIAELNAERERMMAFLNEGLTELQLDADVDPTEPQEE